jgi:hypothetical protein
MGLAGPLLLAAVLLILRRWIPSRHLVASPLAVALPTLVAFAVAEQSHTASYRNLWWWYPVAIVAVLEGRDISSSSSS